MNQLQEQLESIKIKEHIEEKERIMSKIQFKFNFEKLMIFRRYFFNMFFKIKVWFITRRPLVKNIIQRSRKSKITVQNTSIQEWHPCIEEIREEKKKMQGRSHLVLIDMRFIYYTENEIVRLLLKLKKPSEIYLIDDSYLTQKYTNLLFPYILLYGLKIIIDEKDVGKKVKSIFTSRQKEFGHVSIVNSVNMREVKKYKIKGFTAAKYKVQKAKSKIIPKKNVPKKREWYPTIKEIEKVRSEQQEKKNLILWDIENISHKEIDNIIERIRIVGIIYCVSVQPLSQRVTNRIFPYILLYGIRVVVDHEDSDNKIKELIRSNYKKFVGITIVSSDTDFVGVIKSVLNNDKTVHVISRDRQKKGILMRLKIDHKDLSISTI